MKKLILVVLVVVLMLAGCTKEPVTCNKPYIVKGTECCLDVNDNNVCDSDEEIAVKEIKEEVLEETVPEESGEVVEEVIETPKDVTQRPIEEKLDIKKSDECESTLQYQTIKKIDLSIENGPPVYTDDGFSFIVYPQTLDGEIVPAEASITVHIYPTREYGGKREIEDRYILKQSFYRAKEDVQADCSPQPIEIKYNKMLSDRLLTADADDPGAVIVFYKVMNEEFQKEVIGNDEIRFLPPRE